MTRRKNKITKISILILMLLTLFFGVKYYKTSDDFNNYIETSDLENKVLESQLTEILHKYDSLSVKNKIDSLRFDEQLKLVQSGKTSKQVSRFNSIEDSIVFFAKQQQISKEITLKTNAITSPKVVSKTAQLTALNVNAKGVKIYSDAYKMSEAKIQQLRVCFTLEENQLINSGNKTIYVQVVNPKNQIISSGDTSVESDTNIKLQYSASVSTNYQKKDTDVCTYVDLEKNKTIKGKYKINIYHDFVKIGTAIFEY
ncbi:hypothetical protein B0I03_103298 [Flavobacterium aquaticum]|uniref:Uncharacterized protein n=1 Tax=Flavobacterium aquaticum TaxID=1236486 RepID=A0A327YT76_9FLAO|nr:MULTISPECIES: hypothetical protein [Flavobacterium]MCK6607421.1 hypothetical protein [Flavobacterium sp.]RAK23832.1 hypothetical protein B0I03_103298 [Flavobacterium aquaticum]